MEQMEQPFNYEEYDEDILIRWLKIDLDAQRRKLVSQGIKREEIKNEDLMLNIGPKNLTKDFVDSKVKINFDFNLQYIMDELKCTEIDEDGNSKLSCKINLKEIIFNKKTDFSDINYNTDIKFHRSVFNDEADFQDSIFGNVTDFSYSTFNSRVSFSYSIFKQLTNFKNSYFGNKAIFWKIVQTESILFDNITFGKDKGSIFFEQINYDKKNEVFQECHENSKIEIVNTVIDGRIDFRDVKVSKINFKDSNVINGGVLNRINFEAEPENSDTARFLKHEELARSNTIKALEYKAKEKDLYEDELKDNKSNKKFLEIFAERLSLILSRLSNDHGQNWIQAVLFTFITGFIFFFTAYASIYVKNVTIYLVVGIIQVAYPFVLLLIFKKKRAIVMNYPFMFFAIIAMSLLIVMNSSFMKGFFNYLIPINFDLMKEVGKEIKMTPINTFDFDMASLNRLRLFFFYFFYILGKIAIGYGIFQTIQAFRKFNIK